MNLKPRSLSAQTLVVLFAGLVLSHVIGITIYSIDRRDAVTSTEALDVAERIVGVVNLLRQLPAQWREDIVRASDSRSFRVAWGSTRDSAELEPATDLTEEIERYLMGEFPAWPRDHFRVGFGRKPAAPIANTGTSLPNAAAESRTGDFLHISVQLDDGSWVNFAGAVPRNEAQWPGTAGAYIITVALGAAIVVVWLVRRVTAPLSAFASAADRLGKDMRSTPLPETGPTEVVQASRAFNEMQKRLRRLVENRTQMLAAISHDLRTPVTLVRLRTEQGADADDRGKILETLDEMEAMIASVLEFARETSFDEPKRRVDVSAMVASICDDLADAGAPVEFDLPAQIIVTGRRVSLKRAVTNLIDNAVKYGRIAKVKIDERPTSVDLTIEDEGPGVPEDQLERIFMPFYRLDASRSRTRGSGGAGLGLSIAQAVIHEHGGTIRAHNRAEGGFCVSVSLPK